jgi:hypothetical protein
VRALVMELVEGTTLRRTARAGPLPLEEAVAIAPADRRGAGGGAREGDRAPRPQAAERQAGDDGAVKVLDFGLPRRWTRGAAGARRPLASPTLMNSPTLTPVHGTQLGDDPRHRGLHGARSRRVRARSTSGWTSGRSASWLYEMLRGRSLFRRRHGQRYPAGVLKSEIDFDALPEGHTAGALPTPAPLPRAQSAEPTARHSPTRASSSTRRRPGGRTPPSPPLHGARERSPWRQSPAPSSVPSPGVPSAAHVAKSPAVASPLRLSIVASRTSPLAAWGRGGDLSGRRARRVRRHPRRG